MSDPVRILCVDDNEMVLQALTMRLRRAPNLTVVGTLPQADQLPETAQEKQADVVLLDVDMPGRDAFEAMADLAQQRPDIRTIIVSGYIRADLIDRAIASGAWGYLNKSAGIEVIIDAIQRVQEGEFVFGPELPPATLPPPLPPRSPPRSPPPPASPASPHRPHRPHRPRDGGGPRAGLHDGGGLYGAAPLDG